MEVAAALTMWLTFGAFLFCGVVDAPPLFGRTAISLCAGEFTAALTWAACSEDCVTSMCGDVARAARSAAAFDIPALTAVTFGLALAYWVRIARSW